MIWPKAVIHRLAQKIQAGTKFFVNHNADNSHENRISVGEVIKSYIKDIGGKISNIIIGHFPNNENIKDMDVCSVEAEIYTDERNIVGDIENVTGIALGNSNESHPAFPGAVRLAAVQCFNTSGEGEKTVTFEEVKKAIKDMNIHPWQLFNEEDLKNDREFGKIFERVSKAESENERLTKELKESKEASQDAEKKALASSAKSRLDEKMGEGYTEKQKRYIKERFDPEQLQDLSDQGLDKFLESAREDFSKTAKLFGVSEENDKGTSTKDNNENKKSGGTSEDDDPAENLMQEALKEMGVTNG